MALYYDSNFPPGGNAPWAIDKSWCLGDSLPYLNGNFANFDTRINGNTTALAAASATLNTNTASTSSTIITTLSTVPYARLSDGNQSGAAPIFGARALVNFDPTRNAAGVTPDYTNTSRFIRTSNNVASVVKSGSDFIITYTTPLNSSDYVVVGNAGSYPGQTVSITSTALSGCTVAATNPNTLNILTVSVFA